MNENECIKSLSEVFINLKGYALKAADGSAVAWGSRADFVVFTEKTKKGVYDVVVVARGSKFALKDVLCDGDTIEVGSVEAL
ncbi:MAG: hypothetical protein ACP5MH_11085 [Thermoproteus sp.]